jgi:hypothetical protein
VKCRLCNKGANDIGGWLKRVNPLGEIGIWECRPSCDAVLLGINRLIDVIEDTDGADAIPPPVHELAGEINRGKQLAED